MIVSNFQFFGRAQHALAFDATQLANLNEEGFAIFARGQLCTHHGARNANANASVGRTANNVEQCRLTHIHLAHAQAVCIGVLLCTFDFTNHHIRKWRRHGLKFFNLQARHGERFSELFCIEGWVAKLTQPGFRKLHGLLIIEIDSRSERRRRRTSANHSRHIEAW